MKQCQTHDQEKETDYFLLKLKENGGRITEQRKAIVQSIVKFPNPFSAEDLLAKTKNKGIDLATIYRSLNTFNELGLLLTVDFSDGIVRYEYNSHDKSHHHHHIVCTQCKSIEPVNFCVVQGKEHLVKKMGYSQVFHRLEFFGVCKNCT